MEQLILHLIGDYILQSDWMANNKTKAFAPALTHSIVYSLPFLLLTCSPLTLFMIWSTHFLIDRWRLAKYVVWAKNWLEPHPTSPESIAKYGWENCYATGYPSETPQWMAVWLMIIADNTMHLTINYLSLRYL